MKKILSAQEKRAMRNRARLKKFGGGKLRLSVSRSSKNISAQIIDDSKGITLASCSSLEADLRAKDGAKTELATAVGTLVAQRALEKGVTEVMFDRGSYLFHGRVKALAEAARAAGLVF
jgi:large subunit ribosomal protein L18